MSINGDLSFARVCYCNILCCGFSSTESVKKIIEKSSVKFIHGVKLDTKIGKSEDRILVSRCF